MVKAKNKVKSKSKVPKKVSAKEVEIDEEFNEEDDFNEKADLEDEENLNNDDENFEDEENFEGDDEAQPIVLEHKRSKGLFNNPWWKKGVLKGFIVWLIFVVFFYLMDFIGLVEVIDKLRWFFFLVLLVILGMAWEKILYKFIKI